MSVRTKLIGFGLLLAILPLFAGVTLIITSRQVSKAQQKVNLAEAFEEEVFNVTLLTNELTRYRSPRTKRQLGQQQERIQQLTARLKSAATHPDERRILVKIVKHNQRLVDLTAELIATSEALDAQVEPDESRQRWRTRLAGQLLVAAHAVLADGRRLRARQINELVTVQRKADQLVFGTILLAVVLGVGALVMLYHSLVPRLQRLATAVTEFGRGRRDVRLNNDSRDEIGVVCQAFDTMAGDLEQHERHLQTLVDERTADLAESTEALQQSNADLQNFAYVVSHDLREPLRAVSGFGSLLQQRYRSQLDDDGKEFIQHIVDGASHMNDLLDGLLAYSRVGTHGAAFETVDCNEVLDLVLENLHAAIQESDARVEHEKLPTLTCDKTQLIQLFQNLIANSIKYRNQRDVQIHISAARNGSSWQFRVQDNGIGFDPSSGDRIFDIFQRMHPRQDYAGMGVGLAICKRIVQRHGGRIWAESEPDVGSTFYFTISDAGEGDQP